MLIFLLTLLIDIRPPATLPPPRTLPATPSASALPTKTPTATPLPSITPRPTASLITQTAEREKKTYTIFIAITCAGILAVVIIIVTVTLVRKKNSRIYPKTDSDENEPDGISVTVPRIYAEKTNENADFP